MYMCEKPLSTAKTPEKYQQMLQVIHTNIATRKDENYIMYLIIKGLVLPTNGFKDGIIKKIINISIKKYIPQLVLQTGPEQEHLG